MNIRDHRKVLLNVTVQEWILLFDGFHFDCKDNDANRSFAESEKTDALAEVSCSVEI